MALTNTFTASAEVKFGGQTITRVNHVMINQRFEAHHDFEVSVSPSMLQNRFIKLKDVADRFVGNDAFITLRQSRAGAPPQSQTFRGIITAVRLVKGESQSDTYLISGFGMTLQLEAGPTTRSFTDRTLKQLIREIVSPISALPFGTASELDDIKIPYITQYEEDNFHFLQRLCQRFGQWMFYDGTTLIFGKSIRRDTPNVKLINGTNLFNMEYGLKVTPLNFKTKYFNYEKFEVFNGNAAEETVKDLSSFPLLAQDRSKDLFVDDLFSLNFQDHVEESSLKNSVRLKKSEQANKLAVFTGQSSEMEMKIGGLVTITEPVIVNRITTDNIEYGTFVVTRLNHFLDTSGVYQASFEAVPQDSAFPPAEYKVVNPIARPQLARVNEVKDPLGLGRIKVVFWWQGDHKETTPFIRVSSMMTTRSKSYFIPEQDDMVMVDFEYGNPDLPFVVGSMYEGAKDEHKPGSELSRDDNHIKGIITRGGNHIIIDDTDGKEKIRIFNKETKNKIELSLDGGSHINIESNGTINMSAPNINIKASKKLHMVGDEEVLVETSKLVKLDSGEDIVLSCDNTTIEAYKDITFLASNVTVQANKGDVSIEAKKEVAVKATANLSLEGGPMAILKGKVVAIN